MLGALGTKTCRDYSESLVRMIARVGLPTRVNWIQLYIARSPFVGPDADSCGDPGERPEGRPPANPGNEGPVHVGRVPHRLPQRGPRHDRPDPCVRAQA